MFARRHGRTLFKRPSIGTRGLSTSKRPDAPPRYPRIRTVWAITRFATGLAAGTHIFVEYFFSCALTWGISMLPNLASDGDFVLTSKWYRRGRGVVVGDLVTFVHPLDPQTRALKRVIGMPGDFVLRDTPYEGDQLMVQVPAGHCYVAGDNQAFSRDSRLWGPIPLALIRSKVLCKMKTKESWFPWPRRISGGLEEPLEFDDGGLD